RQHCGRSLAAGAKLFGMTARREHPGGSLGQPEGEVGGDDIAVRQPADAVRAEEPRHGSGSDQRFENCDALRAFFRPAFLRSMTRASRVRKPAFLSAGRLFSRSISFRARAIARRRAPAWPEGPPPVIFATTS